MDQHRLSPPSQTNAQCPPESSWDLLFQVMGGLEFSTQPPSLLVTDVSMSGNVSPFLSATQQHHDENTSYPSTVRQVNIYSPLLGHAENHRPTLYSSDETSVASAIQRPFVAQYSLSDIFSQARVKAADDQLAVQVVPVAARAPNFLFPSVNTDIPQSQDQMDESRAITDVVVGNSDDHECAITWTEEAHIPMMPFSSSSATRVNTMHREAPQ
ncbi:hypothetical protein EI94DRAFT_1787378, partial [Lactarius quietus]